MLHLLKTPIQHFSKRVISMRPQKILFDPKNPININQPASSSASSSVQRVGPNKIPQGWQQMPFDKLCSLSIVDFNAIQLEIKKKKMNVQEEYFDSGVMLNDPKELEPYWLQVYEMFCNLKPIQDRKYSYLIKNPYLAKMILDEPENDEKLQKVVSEFVNNMGDVKKLEGIAQASFCKYLLSLKRDLKMKGLDLDNYQQKSQKQIKITKVLSYEYQFWVDVKHNRQKNGTQKQFVIMNKRSTNPNTSLTITQQHPELMIKYISRKKKLDNQMHFVIKILLQVHVDGHRHVVKVERNGPSSFQQDKDLRFGYIVIDYDGVFKGNPTIRPIFVF